MGSGQPCRWRHDLCRPQADMTCCLNVLLDCRHDCRDLLKACRCQPGSATKPSSFKSTCGRFLQSSNQHLTGPPFIVAARQSANMVCTPMYICTLSCAVMACSTCSISHLRSSAWEFCSCGAEGSALQLHSHQQRCTRVCTGYMLADDKDRCRHNWLVGEYKTFLKVLEPATAS